MKISFRYQLKTKLAYNVVPTRRNFGLLCLIDQNKHSTLYLKMGLMMVVAIQLEMEFIKKDPVDLLRDDYQVLNKKFQNVQRGLFARFSTMEEEFEMLRDLCHQQKNDIELLKSKLDTKCEMIEFPIQGKNEL